MVVAGVVALGVGMVVVEREAGDAGAGPAGLPNQASRITQANATSSSKVTTAQTKRNDADCTQRYSSALLELKIRMPPI
jgi:hypothetical protein